MNMVKIGPLCKPAKKLRKSMYFVFWHKDTTYVSIILHRKTEISNALNRSWGGRVSCVISD